MKLSIEHVVNKYFFSPLIFWKDVVHVSEDLELPLMYNELFNNKSNG